MILHHGSMQVSPLYIIVNTVETGARMIPWWPCVVKSAKMCPFVSPFNSININSTDLRLPLFERALNTDATCMLSICQHNYCGINRYLNLNHTKYHFHFYFMRVDTISGNNTTVQ